jgi:quinolinate synthase
MPHLLWVLDNLAEGKVVNEIKVHPHVKHWSLISMNRMLDLVGSGAAMPAPNNAEPQGA